MPRLLLRDAQWSRIEGLLLGKQGDKGRTGADNRLFVEAVLWMACTGALWRDLPPEFGPWNTACKRFWRWAHKGVWQSIFTRLSEDADFEKAFMDSTIVRAHRHVTRASTKKDNKVLATLIGDIEHGGFFDSVPKDQEVADETRRLVDACWK